MQGRNGIIVYCGIWGWAKVDDGDLLKDETAQYLYRADSVQGDIRKEEEAGQ